MVCPPTAYCAPTQAEIDGSLGVVVPLSGVLAPYGEAVRNGCLLAAEDFQSPPSTLMFEDSMSESEMVVSAYEKLAATGARVVFAWGATASEAIAPIAQQRGVPLNCPNEGGVIPKLSRFFR